MIARCNHNYRVNQTSLYMHCPRTQESLSRLQSHIWSQEHPLHHLLVIARWQLVVATRSPSSFGGTSLSRQVWSRERSCTSRTIQTSRSSWSTVSNMSPSSWTTVHPLLCLHLGKLMITHTQSFSVSQTTQVHSIGRYIRVRSLWLEEPSRGFSVD